MGVDWKAVAEAFAGLNVGTVLIVVDTGVGECFIKASSLVEYFHDPDAYHANQLRMSKDRYLSMKAFLVDEGARCRGETKTGRRCKIPVYYMYGKTEPITNFVPGIDDHCDLHSGQRLRKG